MFYVTHVSITLHSTDQLHKIFEIMPNLEELNLSLSELSDSYAVYYSKIPATLRKLHLEFEAYRYDGYPRLDTLKKFLDAFKGQVRLLSLIIINAEKEFYNFDKFESLTNNFEHL